MGGFFLGVLIQGLRLLLSSGSAVGNLWLTRLSTLGVSPLQPTERGKENRESCVGNFYEKLLRGKD